MQEEFCGLLWKASSFAGFPEIGHVASWTSCPLMGGGIVWTWRIVDSWEGIRHRYFHRIERRTGHRLGTSILVLPKINSACLVLTCDRMILLSMHHPPYFPGQLHQRWRMTASPHFDVRQSSYTVQLNVYCEVCLVPAECLDPLKMLWGAPDSLCETLLQV